MGCFLAVRPGGPSFLIPVEFAWRFHAEKYRIIDPPKNAPEISKPIRLDLVDFGKGRDSGEAQSPSESLLESIPLTAKPKRRKRRARKKKVE
jgi:hypothetical protein